MNIKYFYIVLLSLIQCSNQKIYSDTPWSITKSYYQINNEKVDFCDFIESIQNPYYIKTVVDKETPIYMIDSLLNYSMLECYCNNFIITFKGRADKPIEEVLSSKSDLVDCYEPEDPKITVDIPDETIERVCKRYIEEIDSTKTEIFIKNGIIYLNGDSIISQIKEPIRICYNRENTFLDIIKIYSMLMQYYKVNTPKELYKKIRIYNYFPYDDLFYKKAIIRLNNK